MKTFKVSKNNIEYVAKIEDGRKLVEISKNGKFYDKLLCLDMEYLDMVLSHNGYTKIRNEVQKMKENFTLLEAQKFINSWFYYNEIMLIENFGNDYHILDSEDLENAILIFIKPCSIDDLDFTSQENIQIAIEDLVNDIKREV